MPLPNGGDPWAVVGQGGPPASNTPQPSPAQSGKPDPWSVVSSAPLPASVNPSTPSQLQTPVPSTLHIDDNAGIQPGDSAVTRIGKGAMDFAKRANAVGAGIGDGLLDTLNGGATLLHIPHATLQEAQQRLESDNRENPALNTTGKVAEGVAEFAGGDAALKSATTALLADKALEGMSMAQKLKHVAPAVKAMAEHPILASMVRQGAVAGGQALVKSGGDVKQAATEGAVTAATGGLLEGAGGKILDMARKVAPGIASIGGEVIPTLASQAPDADALASKAATIGNTPEYEAAQQAGSKNVVRNIAQKAYQTAIDRINEARSLPSITDESRLLPAPADMQPYQFEIGGPTATEDVTHGSAEPARDPVSVLARGPNPNYRAPETLDQNAISDIRSRLGVTPEQMPDAVFSGPQTTSDFTAQHFPPATGGGSVDTHAPSIFRTSQPEVAQKYVDTLSQHIASPQFANLDPAAQKAAQDSLSDVQKQLQDYRGYQRNFQPVDASQEIPNIHDFGDSVDRIEAAVKPVYQKMDEISGGRFTALRNQLNDAKKVLQNPGTPEAADTARARIEDASDGIDQLFKDSKGQIAPADLKSANSAWRDARLLDKISNAVDNPLSETARELGTSEDINGRTLQTRLSTLLRKIPQDDIDRVIGSDGRQNLYRVAKLLTRPKQELITKTYLTTISKQLGKHFAGPALGAAVGAVAGHAATGAAVGSALLEGGEAGYHYLLRQAATNPALGKAIEYGVKNQIAPKLMVPIIASALAPSAPAPDTSSSQ